MVKLDFFGFKDFSSFWTQIESELEDFAKYLKNVKVDVNLANSPMHTLEKDALSQATNDKYSNFCDAICSKNIEHFIDMKDNDVAHLKNHYKDLIDGFRANYVSKKRLKHYFNELYSLPDSKKVTTVELLKELKLRRPDVFDNKDNQTISSRDGGDIRFKLDAKIAFVDDSSLLNGGLYARPSTLPNISDDVQKRFSNIVVPPIPSPRVEEGQVATAPISNKPNIELPPMSTVS